MTVVYLNGSSDYVQLYAYVYDSSANTEMKCNAVVEEQTFQWVYGIKFRINK